MQFGNLLPLIFYNNMKKILLCFSFITFLLISSPVQAGMLSPGAVSKINSNTSQLNSTAGYNEGADALTIVRIVITVILSLLATIFLFLLIFAGFKWMTAAGDTEDIKKAKGIIQSAIIGLVITLASYGITYFIFNQMTFFSASAPVPNAPSSNTNTGSGN